MWYVQSVSMGDTGRSSLLPAISATLGWGRGYTNVYDELNTQLNTRIDGVDVRVDDVRADIRQLRTLVIVALKYGEPVD